MARMDDSQPEETAVSRRRSYSRTLQKVFVIDIPPLPLEVLRTVPARRNDRIQFECEVAQLNDALDAIEFLLKYKDIARSRAADPARYNPVAELGIAYEVRWWIKHWGVFYDRNDGRYRSVVDDWTDALEVLLELKYMDLAKARAHREAVLAPVYHLPDEVLIMVFRHFIECTAYSRERRVHYPREPYPGPVAELLLGRVCSRWRQIAVSVPQLWTVVSTLRAYPLEISKIWIPRSAGMGLEVLSRQDEGGSWKWSYDCCREALQVVLSVAFRWTVTVLELSFEDVELFLEPRCFPSLRELHFEVEDTGYPYAVCHAFENAPQLRDVDLSWKYGPEYLMLPWSQLHILSLTDVTLNEVARCLEDCANLVSLTAYVRAAGPLALKEPASGYFSNLSTLTMKGGGPTMSTDFYRFWSRLRLPNLIRLASMYGYETATWEPALVDCLRHTKKLESLRLETDSTGETLFRALEGDIVPHLKEFILTAERNDLAEESLICMVESREPPFRVSVKHSARVPREALRFESPPPREIVLEALGGGEIRGEIPRHDFNPFSTES